ncbi:MAG TPA: hypothetical protein VM029_17740 [Opitutaceae bacterium]|nr:hypothetical protein [Opitutaceae bacterium]
MSSFAVKVALGAALFSAPLASFAQRNLGSNSSIGPALRHDVTLLTGPYFLSPASPPKAPVEGQEWNFIRTGVQVDPGTRGTLKLRGREDRADWAKEAEILDAQQKLESARQRLQRLQAERQWALERAKELDTMRVPADPIRFDARMPDAPRLQLSKPAETQPPVKRD